jgi:hypothetical protein
VHRRISHRIGGAEGPIGNRLYFSVAIRITKGENIPAYCNAAEWRTAFQIPLQQVARDAGYGALLVVRQRHTVRDLILARRQFAYDAAR